MKYLKSTFMHKLKRGRSGLIALMAIPLKAASLTRLKAHIIYKLKCISQMQALYDCTGQADIRTLFLPVSNRLTSNDFTSTYV